ncbi:MAG: 50S ribosomal protein L24 [Alphaproteobacteria bacterium]|nr:50S ribosomal protein L24 [Alphaproteobacteria bacterium]
MKIRKDDTVVVITGRDKGKSGKVLKVMPTEGRLVVQGVNVAKRHTRGRPGQPGGIIEKELAIATSNVAHVDPRDNKPTRVGFKVVDGKKVRFAKRSGELIDR